MFSTWIVPYNWSYFSKDGYLQPYFTRDGNGGLRLERCALLNHELQQVGMWERSSMPAELVKDIERSARQQHGILPPKGTRVAVTIVAKKAGR